MYTFSLYFFFTNPILQYEITDNLSLIDALTTHRGCSTIARCLPGLFLLSGFSSSHLRNTTLAKRVITIVPALIIKLGRSHDISHFRR